MRLAIVKGGGIWTFAPYRRGQEILKAQRFDLPYIRHPHVVEIDGHLISFFSRIGDEPEEILASLLTKNREGKFEFGNPIRVISPDLDYEGYGLVNKPSVPGPSKAPVRQLRDPYYFQDKNGESYIFYSVKGEFGIAVATLSKSELLDRLLA
jgi:hypothetical protein